MSFLLLSKNNIEFIEIDSLYQVQPITVASQEYAAGTQALMTGWGKTSGGILGQIPDTMQYAYTNLISQVECAATWGSQVTARMQCANDNTNSACNVSIG